MAKSKNKSAKITGTKAAQGGYQYQLNVSVLFALKVLVDEHLTDQIILEPDSEEDLELEIQSEHDVLTTGMLFKKRKLVVQCKLRNRCSWTISALVSLLKHGKGKRRVPAKDRLKDSTINYLLVTSADLSGKARNLAVDDPVDWSQLKAMPPSMVNELSADFDGRVAVWNLLDEEKLNYRIKDILSIKLHIPASKITDCIKKLQKCARDRMGGAGEGVWTRDQVIRTINDHDGYHGVPRDLKEFVKPTIWADLINQLKTRHAVVLTGPSGTGKTTAAKALIATLREANPHMTHVKITGGPEEVHGDKTLGSVVYEIEDPWGQYKLESFLLDWNAEISRLLNSASADRKFVVTSRSDILDASRLTTLDERFQVSLLEEHYRESDRGQMFDFRLYKLPREVQISVLAYKDTVLKELPLPLEIDRFFGNAGLGTKKGEIEYFFIHRCLDESKRGFIKRSIIQSIEGREDWELAAIIWVLIKVNNCVTFDVLKKLEPSLYGKFPKLEDKLLPFVRFLKTGSNLKEVGAELSFAHPLVEAGLEKLVLEYPNKTSRVIGYFIEVLIDLNESLDGDWGTETAVRICAATSSIEELNLSVSDSFQKEIDTWLETRLSKCDSLFRNDFSLAVNAGSKNCAVAELARWLHVNTPSQYAFLMKCWEVPERSLDWYDWISKEPYTHTICATFIKKIIGFSDAQFAVNFHQSVEKLSTRLTPAFRDGLINQIWEDRCMNAETLINGALVDLKGFESALSEAANKHDELESRDFRNFMLDLHNENYDFYLEKPLLKQWFDEGHTARKIITAYIVAHRKVGEWQKLANHPRRDSFIWEWIQCIYLNDAAEVDPGELNILANSFYDHPHEGGFWNVAKIHFNNSLSSFLEKRLRDGSQSRKIRVAAAQTALDCAPMLVDDLFSSSSELSAERTLELAMDICASQEGPYGTVAEQQKIIDKHTATLAKNVVQAIYLILEFPDATTSSASIKILQSVPDSTGPHLNLAIAKALRRCGENTTNRIRNILKIKFDILEENIELVKQAMQIGVDLDDQSLILTGLAHEFTLCRITAMNAVFSSSTVPLPLELLNMRGDKSSLVRNRLVGMLEEKPHENHTTTLIELTFDTWTSISDLFDSPCEYPIAKKACDLLLKQAFLTNDEYKRVVESLKSSESDQIKLGLLQTMVRHGSPTHRDKIVKFIIGKKRSSCQALMAQALVHQYEDVEIQQLDLISDNDITSVDQKVAMWLVPLLTIRSSDERILQMGRCLAANQDRVVLLALSYLFTFFTDRDELNADLCKLLPENISSTIIETVSTKDTSSLECLNDLGDVEIVEEVKSFIRRFIKRSGQTVFIVN